MGDRIYTHYDGSFYRYDDGRATNDVPGFTIKRGYAFAKWMTCGNYQTPEESPYGFGCYLLKGPMKCLERTDDLLSDYDDRLRGWYPDRWDEAWKRTPSRHFRDLSMADLSRFLSILYGFQVECLQVFRGCNVSNGYPYHVFVSRRLNRDSDRSGEAGETRSGSTEGESAGLEEASPTPGIRQEHA